MIQPWPEILLVEDNEMNRDMLSRRLERAGYQVILAMDGRRGLAAARSEAPDLILMDMSLPEIDGWEATRHLKSDDSDTGHPGDCADRARDGRAIARRRSRQAATITTPSRWSFARC